MCARGRKHCKCMGKLQSAVTLILRRESKVKSLHSIHSARRCKNYVPKCSQFSLVPSLPDLFLACVDRGGRGRGYSQFPSELLFFFFYFYLLLSVFVQCSVVQQWLTSCIISAEYAPANISIVPWQFRYTFLLGLSITAQQLFAKRTALRCRRSPGKKPTDEWDTDATFNRNCYVPRS